MIKTCKPDWIIADIVAEIPEAPVVLIQRSLMRAVRQFATTCIYEVWVNIPTQAEVQHYPFERYLPDDYTVQYITDVMYNNCCIPCLDEGCQDQCSSGYTVDDLTQISLVGYCPSSDDPGCPEELKVRVVLKPKPDACEIPCDMLEMYEDELRDGALGILLSMKNKRWTDFRAAEFYENRFQGGLASAKCLNSQKINPRDHSIPGERLL